MLPLTCAYTEVFLTHSDQLLSCEASWGLPCQMTSSWLLNHLKVGPAERAWLFFPNIRRFSFDPDNYRLDSTRISQNLKECVVC